MTETSSFLEDLRPGTCGVPRLKKLRDEGLLVALCEASVLALLKSKQEVASVLVNILKPAAAEDEDGRSGGGFPCRSPPPPPFPSLASICVCLWWEWAAAAATF